jgi:hypothetical protein
VAVPAVDKASAPAPVSAAADRQLPSLEDWTFFQLGFVPGYPTGCRMSNVYGMKLGAPMTSGYGRVYGVEPSIFYSGTDHIMGAQASWFGPAIGKEIIGVQAGPGSAVAKSVRGFQAGAASVSETVEGVQAAIVSVADRVAGAQFAAVNVANDEVRGLQFGMVNYSGGKSCQIGLVNIIEGGEWPFMLLFNLSR